MRQLLLIHFQSPSAYEIDPVRLGSIIVRRIFDTTSKSQSARLAWMIGRSGLYFNGVSLDTETNTNAK